MNETHLKYNLTGTKAETLFELVKLGYNIPQVHFFTCKDWVDNKNGCLSNIQNLFAGQKLLAIRSSAKAEDRADTSMAGAFESVLNIDVTNLLELESAINKVINSFDDNLSNQVLVQPMVKNVAMSGVAMTKVLDDGSPYYVVNFDDSTGLTDTVTSGNTINKTVYIYNGVNETDFDSKFLLSLIKTIWNLEETFRNIPLDIEFAVDHDEIVHILQVRRITTLNSWNTSVNELVSDRIKYLADYVDNIMNQRRGLAGSKTLLGIMPDWNPAEMIGVVPHPLAMSLYRELITKSTWRKAREIMGYKKLPNVELMVSLFGRAYIDVRNSINSFIPEGLDEKIQEKIVNAYINRLESRPYLHDKIEFEVVFTAYDFELEAKFKERYLNVLDREEFLVYKSLLRKITANAIRKDENSTLNQALKNIDELSKIQSEWTIQSDESAFYISDKINTLLNECIELGTIPFAIIARHGFIAESILRSAISLGVISEERIKEYKRSIKTISSDLSEDFYKVSTQELSSDKFKEIYGHLRPSSYDILSPNYENRSDLFDGVPHKPNKIIPFVLTEDEVKNINILLAEHGFDNINANDLFEYSKKAIIGREYSKFVFTKHLSKILELIALWGSKNNFTREEMALLNIDQILNILFSPLTNEVQSYFEDKINKSNTVYELASSFKLSYLIRSTRDIYIVPQQRSTPNFIGDQRIEADVVLINPHTIDTIDMVGKIVCIEGADPGYDWIFSRDILGLITKYGGANSHMAIRCAEYNLPAAIGCGEQPFERVISAGKCLLDCQAKRLEPIILNF